MTARRTNGSRSLEATLKRRFRAVETTVDVRGRRLSILHPASAEDLIDEGEFERDERLPYWAELWPSSRVLAAELIGVDGAGRTLLELGCGSGLVATCAALARFRVCASDYYEDALRFARVNASRNGAGNISTRLLDWRASPRSLPRFDVVVASDVLYERPYGELVASVLAATLAPGGLGLVADPGRVARDEFVDAAGRAALQLTESAVRFVDGSIRQTVTVFRIVAAA